MDDFHTTAVIYQEAGAVKKAVGVCVYLHFMCAYLCVFYAWELRVGVLLKGEKQLLHSY